MKRLVILMIGVAIAISIMMPLTVMATPAGFVTTSGTGFVKDGSPFYYGGTNSYLVNFKTQPIVDDHLQGAAAMNLRVIRIWGFLDVGMKNADGTFSNNTDGIGSKDGVYYQYWNPATNAPAYNIGPDGLQRLDYAIYKCSQLGIKVILPLVNNWKDFGGMPQYCAWLGLTNTDEFYTNPTLKQYYKNYINMIFNRTNVFSGIQYKNDPTIFCWELANEPRSGDTTGDTLVNWATEISQYMKSLDPNHMVSVGDEGFYNLPYGVGGNSDYECHGGAGVDWNRFIRIPTIDFGTVHLYPDSWHKTASWGTEWIKNHIKDGNGIGKPVILEEFGLNRDSTKTATYPVWLNAAASLNGAGWNFWMIGGHDETGAWGYNDGGYFIYPDGGSLCNMITTKAAEWNAKTTPVLCEPSGFYQTEPACNATVTTRTPTFKWEASVGATSYTLQVTTSKSWASYALNISGITTNYYTPTAPLATGKYYWRVIANNALGTTSARNINGWFSL